MKKSNSGLVIAGLVLGIVALILSAVPIINNFAFVLAAIALVIGIVGVAKKHDGPKGKSVATIILAVVAVVVVLASQYIYSQAAEQVSKDLNQASQELNETADRASGKKTDDILKNDLSVELGQFTVTQGEFLTETSLPVKVTNKLNEKKSYSVKIEAVDAEGKRLADDTVYANDLGAEQAQDLKAFQYVESGLVESLKNATFKIVTVTQS